MHMLIFDIRKKKHTKANAKFIKHFDFLINDASHIKVYDLYVIICDYIIYMYIILFTYKYKFIMKKEHSL